MRSLRSLFSSYSPALIADENSWSYRSFYSACLHKFPQKFAAVQDASSVFSLFSGFFQDRPVMPLNFRLPKHLLESRYADYPLLYSTQLLTSGSTGTPKIACHSLENHCLSALGANPVLNLAAGDRWLLSLPLFHVGGIQILFRCFHTDATAVISKKPLAQAILQHKITHLSLVATQLYRLLKEPSAILKQLAAQLKCLLLGGGGLPKPLLLAAHEAGLPVVPSYGMTETTSIICTPDQVLPYRELRLSDSGEIFVKGEVLFQGYLQADGSIQLPLDADGWFATGDIGRIHAGQLELVGRKDNLFISGGENIQPEEIEECLMQIEGIRQCIVVPIDDEEFGARPAAFVALEHGHFDPISWKCALKEQLPGYKIPVLFAPFEQTAFKPDRKQLQALAAQLAAAQAQL